LRSGYLNDTCQKDGDIRTLFERIKNLAARQDRHHIWLNNVESDCRAGRADVEKFVAETFKEVVDKIDKTRTTYIYLTLTVILIFGGLFSAIVVLLRNGH
jgi:predicted neutral ceramidase superfamily lipid hydrolase